MSYCDKCGEKNLPRARYCGNCATPLPPPKQEKLRPGYGYNIHHLDCDHGLKIGPMDTQDKLNLLGKKKYLFLGNLFLILCAGFLLMFNIFKTDNPMWQEFLGQKAGLFGPNGQFFTALYFLFLCISLLIAGNPLYTRNTYNPRQLLFSMIMEALPFPIIGITIMGNFYFGDFLGTTLCTGGFFLLLVSLAGLIIQCMLIKEYKRLKKSGVYSYVAN